MSLTDDRVRQINEIASTRNSELEWQVRADRLIQSNGGFLWKSLGQALEKGVQRVNSSLQDELYRLTFERVGEEKLRICRARYPAICLSINLDLDGHRVRFATVYEPDSETPGRESMASFRIRVFGSDLQLANGEQLITIGQAVELLLNILLS